MKRYENFDLTNFNGYRLNSTCQVAFFPENEHDIIDAITKHPNLIIMGSGHNIILSKEYYDCPFLIFNGIFDKIESNSNILEVGSGAFLKDVSTFALKKSLSGLEFCYDIPSSVGGAVVMNAGTKEGVISDVLEKVRFLDLTDLQVKEFEKEELELGYRSSYFQKNNSTIILRAWFDLQAGNPDQIEKTMRESKTRRWNAQPREHPNCGSVFKRPTGMFVGPMIEELGLKGFQIGGAQISEKHGGFIVNKRNATGKDILLLIEEVKNSVLEKFNIKLEVEQRVV